MTLGLSSLLQPPASSQRSFGGELSGTEVFGLPKSFSEASGSRETLKRGANMGRYRGGSCEGWAAGHGVGDDRSLRTV